MRWRIGGFFHDLEGQIDKKGRLVEIELDLGPALSPVNLDDLPLQPLERPLLHDDPAVLVETYRGLLQNLPKGEKMSYEPEFLCSQGGEGVIFRKKPDKPRGPAQKMVERGSHLGSLEKEIPRKDRPNCGYPLSLAANDELAPGPPEVEGGDLRISPAGQGNLLFYALDESLFFPGQYLDGII